MTRSRYSGNASRCILALVTVLVVNVFTSLTLTPEVSALSANSAETYVYDVAPDGLPTQAEAVETRAAGGEDMSGNRLWPQRHTYDLPTNVLPQHRYLTMHSEPRSTRRTTLGRSASSQNTFRAVVGGTTSLTTASIRTPQSSKLCGPTLHSFFQTRICPTPFGW